jgi:hypothetical protein
MRQESSNRYDTAQIVLQPNDLELLRILAEDFTLLTRKHIELFFPGKSVQRTNFRLQKLLRSGYLSRRYSPLLAPQTALYYLGPKSADALHGDQDAIQDRRRQVAKTADGSLPHLLLTNAVHIKFLTASRDQTNFRLLSRIPHHAPVWNSLNEYGFPLRPDGYVEYDTNGFTFRDFLGARRP